MFTASTNTLAGAVLLDAIAGLVMLYALIRVCSTPAWMWVRGGWSKLGWIVAALWLTPTYGHVAWPVGAALAIRQVRHLVRQPLPGPPPLPFATGEADPAWWNVDVPPTPAPDTSPDPAGDGRQPEPQPDDANPVLALWENSAGWRPIESDSPRPSGSGSPGSSDGSGPKDLA